MITKKQLVDERENLLSLRGLVEVYEEIAATKMQKVRGEVIQSRYFLAGLMRMYHKAKDAYTGDVKLRFKNGLTVAVYVSANSGLYGDIVEKTFEEFRKFVMTNKCQAVILGKLGVKIVDEMMPGYLYNYYDISDDSVDMESFEMMMGYLLQFENIMVFYGQFRSILNQEAVMTAVTGELEGMEKERKTDVVVKTKYLFEPSPAAIASLFEGEILASIFEQTLHEASLAKFASRMLSLDHAADNIQKRMGNLNLSSRRLDHLVQARKQLNTFLGVKLWRR